MSACWLHCVGSTACSCALFSSFVLPIRHIPAIFRIEYLPDTWPSLLHARPQRFPSSSRAKPIFELNRGGGDFVRDASQPTEPASEYTNKQTSEQTNERTNERQQSDNQEVVTFSVAFSPKSGKNGNDLPVSNAGTCWFA